MKLWSYEVMARKKQKKSSFKNVSLKAYSVYKVCLNKFKNNAKHCNVAQQSKLLSKLSFRILEILENFYSFYKL